MTLRARRTRRRRTWRKRASHNHHQMDEGTWTKSSGLVRPHLDCSDGRSHSERPQIIWALLHALSLREVTLFRTLQPRRFAVSWARKAFPFKGHNWLGGEMQRIDEHTSTADRSFDVITFFQLFDRDILRSAYTTILVIV
jgi:hypothetical protein